MIQPLNNEPSAWTLCWVDVDEPLPVEDDFFLPTILLLVGPGFEPLVPPEICPELDQVQVEEWVSHVFDDLGVPDELLVWKAEEWVAEDWKFFGRDWKTKVKITKPLPHEARLHSQLGMAEGAVSAQAGSASQISAGLVRNVSRLRSQRKRRATLEKAATLDPANTAALIELADMEFQAGHYRRSFDLVTRIADVDVLLIGRRGVDWWNDRSTRPLLRALFGMMLCQWHLGNIPEAAETGGRLLECDTRDHMGARFYVPLFLLLAGEHEEAAAFFRHYALHYPKDMPNAWLSFAWAFSLGMEGDDPGARKKYREGMLANIYIAARLLGERPPPEDIFHPSERDEAHLATEFAGSFGGLWDREASAMRSLRDAHEEMRPAIAKLVEHRAAMTDRMDQRYDPDYRAKWAKMLDEDAELVRKFIESAGD